MTCIIYKGDMKDESNKVDNDSIDLLVTDIPYNISIESEDVAYMNWEGNSVNHHEFDKDSDHDWDKKSDQEYKNDLVVWADIWAKKLRKDGQFYIFVADRYISTLWNILEEQGLTPKRVITWTKPNAVPFNRKALYISACEFIIWGVKQTGKNSKGKTFNSSPIKGVSGTDIIEAESLSNKIINVVQKHARKEYETRAEFEKEDPEYMIDLILSQCKQELIKAVKKPRPDEESKKNSQKRADETYEKRRLKAIKEGKPEPKLKEIESYDDKLRLILPNSISFPSVTGGRDHPTEKPVRLLQYFISVSSNEGDNILDTFGGSGSTGEAACLLKRNAVVIEREDIYIKKMKKRLEKFIEVKSDIDSETIIEIIKENKS